MAKTERTGKTVSSAAGKVLHSKTASKAEKAVAASALAQTKSRDITGKAVGSTAAKIIRDPKASKERSPSRRPLSRSGRRRSRLILLLGHARNRR